MKLHSGFLHRMSYVATFAALSAVALSCGPSAKDAGLELTPSLQTPVMDGNGDVADDSAVYINGDSTWIIADDKDDRSGGVYVYDNKGKQVGNKYDAGKIGNIDLRSNVSINGKAGILVGANNRTTSTINLWSLDPSTGTLTELDVQNGEVGSSGYGFCFGLHNSILRAFVTGKDGSVQQFVLKSSNHGFTATKETTYTQKNSTEGCVFDDASGVLYTAEDSDGSASGGTKSIIKYDITKDGVPTVIDADGNGHLQGDIEGLAILPVGTRRYLIASSQGSSQFAVYDITDSPEHVLNFSVGAKGNIDATGETDGLSVGIGDAGAEFPHGLLVVHDGTIAPGRSTSNLKLIELGQLLSKLPAT